jgi:hypothetical protein
MSRVRRYVIATGLALSCAAAAPLAQGDDRELTELKQTHRYKDYTWVDQRSGDCHQSGVLTIFDHGYAIWSGSSKTDSTTFGDIWHATFEMRNANGQRLFGFGQWDSPIMYPGSQYNWRRTATFPSHLFDAAASAVSLGEC